ncbi:MAG TPA: hypothetical protein VHJ82_02750 [Actinomycetota bacterium]|nr:hypothetical protein [Actinomycetota bacterium]
MDLIAPHSSAGRWVLVPAAGSRYGRRSFRRTQARRIRVLQFLLGAVAITLLAALYGGEGIWEIQLLTDLALIGYVVFLLEAKRRRQDRVVKVPARAVRTTRHREAIF